MQKLALVARKPVFGVVISYLENLNFTCSKFTYETFQKANNKGADQTARISSLVFACVIRKPLKTGFLATRRKTDLGIFDLGLWLKCLSGDLKRHCNLHTISSYCT